MAAHIFHVNGKQVVFGLNWMPLSGEQKELAEVRALARDNSAAYQVRHASDHATVYGFLSQEDVPSKIKKPQFVSATMLLATFNNVAPNAIWIEVEAQSAKLAVLENGDPSPAGDFFGTIQEADEIIQRIQSDAGEMFTFYGNYTEVYPHSIPLSLVDLMTEGSLSAATLVKAEKGVSLGMMAMTFLAGVLVGGYFYYDYYKQAEQARLVEEQRKKPKTDSVKMYQDAVQKALPTAGVPSSSAAPMFLGEWQRLEVLQAGWKLARIDCEPEACTYVWSIAGGNNATLRSALGDLPYQFNLEGTEAKYTLANNGKQSATLDISALPTFSSFSLTTGAFFQNLRLIGLTVPVEQPVVFAAEPGINLQAIKSPIRFGKFSIEGQMAVLKEVFSRMPDSVTFKRLEVKIEESQPKFKLEGNYYVKD